MNITIRAVITLKQFIVIFYQTTRVAIMARHTKLTRKRVYIARLPSNIHVWGDIKHFTLRGDIWHKGNFAKRSTKATTTSTMQQR